jgi:hypothetical protein
MTDKDFELQKWEALRKKKNDKIKELEEKNRILEDHRRELVRENHQNEIDKEKLEAALHGQRPTEDLDCVEQAKLKKLGVSREEIDIVWKGGQDPYAKIEHLQNVNAELLKAVHRFRERLKLDTDEGWIK